MGSPTNGQRWVALDGGYDLKNSWMLQAGPWKTPDLMVCQNLVPLVNIKIAGKWMFIPPKNGINRYWSIPIWLWNLPCSPLNLPCFTKMSHWNCHSSPISRILKVLFWWVGPHFQTVQQARATSMCSLDNWQRWFHHWSSLKFELLCFTSEKETI